MSFYELSFAKIIILQENVAEVIINEGIEINNEMVTEYHNFLLQHLTAPFFLLINKINSYTYTFDAQIKIASLPEIKAMAVVAYSKATEVATRNLASIPRNNAWNIQIFPDRDTALEWLSSLQSGPTLPAHDKPHQRDTRH
jgi:hypothetical protein